MHQSYSDSSTPARESKPENRHVMHKNLDLAKMGNSHISPLIPKEMNYQMLDLQNSCLDTKRPNSYSKQKKFISRNTTLKVSRTSKEETMVNIIERKIIQKLKETERAKFSSNLLEQRFGLIED